MKQLRPLPNSNVDALSHEGSSMSGTAFSFFVMPDPGIQCDFTGCYQWELLVYLIGIR
jgi:hypothetical protein